jgi:hypothetical protein
MLGALGAIAPLAKMLFSTVDKAIPDKDLAEKLKAQLNTQLLQSSTEEIKAAASIVEAEAKSHWFCSQLETFAYVRTNIYIGLELCCWTCYKNLYRNCNNF